MLKYYKEFFSGYENASLIQTLILLAFVTFFAALFYMVWKKPKGYYKAYEESVLDLEDDQDQFIQEENKKIL